MLLDKISIYDNIEHYLTDRQSLSTQTCVKIQDLISLCLQIYLLEVILECIYMFQRQNRQLMDLINDGQVLPLLKCLIHRYVLPHRCQILTLLRSTMSIWSKNVVGPCNALVLTQQNYEQNSPSRMGQTLSRDTHDTSLCG